MLHIAPVFVTKLRKTPYVEITVRLARPQNARNPSAAVLRCPACENAEFGRTIWIADAHRGDGKRFVVRADDKLTKKPQIVLAVSGQLSHYGVALSPLGVSSKSST
jgi:hypothetical protein